MAKGKIKFDAVEAVPVLLAMIHGTIKSYCEIQLAEMANTKDDYQDLMKQFSDGSKEHFWKSLESLSEYL